MRLLHDVPASNLRLTKAQRRNQLARKALCRLHATSSFLAKPGSLASTCSTSAWLGVGVSLMPERLA